MRESTVSTKIIFNCNVVCNNPFLLYSINMFRLLKIKVLDR